MVDNGGSWALPEFLECLLFLFDHLCNEAAKQRPAVKIPWQQYRIVRTNPFCSFHSLLLYWVNNSRLMILQGETGHVSATQSKQKTHQPWKNIIIEFRFTKNRTHKMKWYVQLNSSIVLNSGFNCFPRTKMHPLIETHYHLPAWCSSWAMELSTLSCHAPMSFFWATPGWGSSYLQRDKTNS